MDEIDEMVIRAEKRILETREFLMECPNYGMGWHIRNTGIVKVDELL